MKKKEIPIIVDFKDFGQQKALKFNVNSIIAKEFCMMFFFIKRKLSQKNRVKIEKLHFFCRNRARYRYKGVVLCN